MSSAQSATQSSGSVESISDLGSSVADAQQFAIKQLNAKWQEKFDKMQTALPRQETPQRSPAEPRA